MPAASGAGHKYAWMDHDPVFLTEAPPVINQWYTVIEDDDIRELLFWASYEDDEQTGAILEVQWTLDGTSYFCSLNVSQAVETYVMKDQYPSQGGIAGLSTRVYGANNWNYDDKRCLHGKFEVRVVSALGTNPVLGAVIVYETLEVT